MRTKLTDLAIDRLKHQKAQKDYWDISYPCLALRVGALKKTWVVSIGKPRRRIKIGVYPYMGLADARKRAERLLSPSTNYGITVAEASEEYLKSLTIRPRTRADYTRLLTKRILPVIGTRRLSELSASHILNVTDPLRDRPAECRHAHAVVSAFLSWCVPRHLSQNPMAGLKMPVPASTRSRVLTIEELKNIWTASKHLGDFGCVVRLCILTGQRRGELSATSPQWLAEKVFTIPGAITKNKREHSIPLPEASLTLIRNSPFSVRTWSKPKARLDKLSGVSNWTLHDIRRSFSTHLNDLGVQPHVVERMLNHAVKGIEGVYNRSQRLEQMSHAFALWQAHLESAIGQL